MLSKLKERLFGIKPKNEPIKPVGIIKTIVPPIFIDGQKEKDIIWHRDKFDNKIYL